MPRRRPDEEQKALYELWRQSDLTGIEFCKRNSISSKSLWRWRKKYEINATNSKETNKPIFKDLKFYPIREVENHGHKDSLLEIMLPKGISCKVYLPERSINILLQELLK